MSPQRPDALQPETPATDMPLGGLRVLDLSRVVSGPFAARMMSDLGADVVKLEPPDGDMTRLWGEVRHGLSGFYTQQNAGKRDICVAMAAPGAVELVVSLAGVADVVIENFRPGVMDRLGIGWAVLSAANPRLVMLSISGFASDGAQAGRAAYAPIIHAESGLIARQAAFDGNPPTDPMLSIADTNAALHGLVGVLAALHMRQRTGRGQQVRIAMIDAMLFTDDYAHHALDGFPINRLGGEVWESCGGGVMVSGVFPFVWRQLHDAHGLEDGCEPGTELEAKIAARRSAVASWMASFDDQAKLVAALDVAGLAWAEVRHPGQAFDAASAQGAWAAVDDRGGATRRVTQSPYRFSDARAGVRGGAPHRGEHNAEVLTEWLGISSEEVRSLEHAGVLRTDPVLGAP